MNDPKIKIVILVGSVRPGNYTSKAVALVEDELRTLGDIAWETIDTASLTLPLPGMGTNQSQQLLQEKVKAATGVIIATPEYHGGISSVTKLLIDNLGFPSMLAGKPVALLGVAAGAIGAIKALEMVRSICSHVGCIVLPSVVSVAGVQSIFTPEGTCTDATTEKRVRGVAHTIVDYIKGSICPGIILEQMVREQK